MRCTPPLGWVLAGAVAVAAAPARAWHGKGHARATRAAVAALPKELPGFFRRGGEAIAHSSQDPDTFTRPIAPAELHAAESPEHYFDLERLGGAPIPAGRYELLTWCIKKDIPPASVGLLPQAITEWTQRLAVAFAEHRKWPENVHVRRKCLVYAGNLAHYAQDLHQPLHTTIHFDGRARPDGSSPKSGIHLKLDAALAKLPEGAEVRIDPGQVRPFEALFQGVLGELKASHALVDRVYALERQLPAEQKPLGPDGPVSEFLRQRLKASALLTARLFLTAWRDSARLELPPWHVRPATTTAPAGGAEYTPAPAATQPRTRPADRPSVTSPSPGPG
jgi:hypothetical protein